MSKAVAETRTAVPSSLTRDFLQTITSNKYTKIAQVGKTTYNIVGVTGLYKGQATPRYHISCANL